jgi:hypothetical protein
VYGGFLLSLVGGTVECSSVKVAKISFGINEQRLLNQRIYMNPADPTKYAIDPDNRYPPDEIDEDSGIITFDIPNTQIPRILFQYVWDRQQLFMHATFSPARNWYVAEMNETYQFAEKDYAFDGAQFDVWFSLDGRVPFVLHNDDYMFELQFDTGEK